MARLSKFNIRTKLVFIIMIVSVVVVLITGVLRIAWDAQQSRKMLEQQITTFAHLIADRSSAALAFNNAQLAEENLNSLSSMPHIITSCLYREDTSLMAEYRRENLEAPCPELSLIRDKKSWMSDDRLHVSVEIKEGDLHLGYMYICSDLSFIYKQRKDQIIFTVVALSIALLIAIFLAGRLQRVISEPIEAITTAARKIEELEDNSARAKVVSEDEIGELATKFNSMLDAIDTKNKLLHRSQKMDALGKLTGGIAHDFNNILGVILGYSELIVQLGADNEKIKKYSEQIYSAGQRGSKLTKKLLSFSRSNRTTSEKININQLLLEEQHMLEKTLTARIELVYQLDDDLWDVYVDQSDFENAILNMSINAMHAITNSGELCIKTSNIHLDDTETHSNALEVGDYVVVSIKDSGHGMPPEVKEKIFDPFYSTKGDKGTGLGLSQVYGFVKASGGDIQVHSNVGEGTCFLLYFPRSYAKDDRKESNINEPIDNIQYSESILVVDDEESLRELAGDILSRQGYKVLFAENGTQAIEMLKLHKIDLLFSDVIMPGVDGYTLSNYVQRNYPQIKIQLASGFTELRDIQAKDKTLYRDLIEKPYTAKDLLINIRRLLN